MKRILALKHAWEVPEGETGTIMKDHGIAYDVVNVEEESLPDPRRYAALLILGGPQHLYQNEEYPFLASELEHIRTALANDIPTLGICLGGQLLALAAGAEVKKHTCSEIGFYDVCLTSTGTQDPLMAGLPEMPKVFHWHSDVFEVPTEATLLATGELAPNQAFRIGERAYGLQYHIELNTPMLDTWLYHPECQSDMFKTIGKEGHAAIVQDRQRFFQLYKKHSRILFENFLHLSSLLS